MKQAAMEAVMQTALNTTTTTRRPSHGLRRALALATLTLVSACSSLTPVPEGDALPFHVALIPTEIHDTSQPAGAPTEAVWVTGTEAEPGQGRDDMRLQLTSRAVSEALRQELGHAFVRATLLDLPDDPAGLSALSPAQREQHWQEEARKVGADLLVRSRLLLDPSIDGERNEKFWLNLPLFLIGGPMCYFVSDRSYRLNARLQAEVFDASVGHETLGEFALLTIPLYAEFQQADLDFLDRADDAGDYALSLLVPAGLLARETVGIEKELEDRVPHELGRQLAVRVFSERAQFELNPSLGAFRLEAGDARLEPGKDGTLRMHVPVQELGRSRLFRYEVRSGDALLADDSFPENPVEDGRRVIEREVTLPEGTRYLSVRVVDASSNTRSYTLAVPQSR